LSLRIRYGQSEYLSDITSYYAAGCSPKTLRRATMSKKKPKKRPVAKAKKPVGRPKKSRYYRVYALEVSIRSEKPINIGAIRDSITATDSKARYTISAFFEIGDREEK